LDVPFCLHRDNANQTKAYIDTSGRLAWADTARLPLPKPHRKFPGQLDARGLLHMLGHNERRYDRERLMGVTMKELL
jgi:methylaspartate mutase epsilon subunit